MEKTRVIVDTCFLQKLSSEGKNVDNIKKVIETLEYVPVVHPYISKYELSLHSYLKKLIDEEYIQVIPYEKFLKDACDKQAYEAYFRILYEDLRLRLKAIGSPKRMAELCLSGKRTIYNIHSQGSNIGDVHMMLMAAFMRLPILLTEDSDIELLRDIAERRMRLGEYSLQILSGVDLIKIIAQKKGSSITARELENILKNMGERRKVSEVKALRRNAQGWWCVEEVTEILLELQKNGVQIFVATHSYNFAKYLEIRRENEKQDIFHNLYKDKPQKDSLPKEIQQFVDDEKEIIYSQSAYKMDELKKNHFMIEDNKLLDEIFDF